MFQNIIATLYACYCIMVFSHLTHVMQGNLYQITSVCNSLSHKRNSTKIHSNFRITLYSKQRKKNLDSIYYFYHGWRQTNDYTSSHIGQTRRNRSKPQRDHPGMLFFPGMNCLLQRLFHSFQDQFRCVLVRIRSCYKQRHYSYPRSCKIEVYFSKRRNATKIGTRLVSNKYKRNPLLTKSYRVSLIAP